MSLVRQPKRLADFLQFGSGKRYAFVIRADGDFRVAPMASDEDRNPYSPAAIASGAPVLTAGGVIVIHANAIVQKVVVDADSDEYCPTPDSLRHVLAVFARAGIAGDLVRIDNRPRSCISDIPVRAPFMAGRPGNRDYGDVMVEIGRRFRLLGDAIVAREADRADYELLGLLRGVRDDLPQASPAEGVSPGRLEPFARRFLDSDFAFLRQAVWDENWTRAGEGYGRMAATCNECHVAGHVGFLRVGDARLATRP